MRVRAPRLRAGLAVALACVAACGPSKPEYDLDALGVPRFVSTNYLELSEATRVSLFRSSVGHDYSDGNERCRSMKHYFMYPTAASRIYAPVTGTVTEIFDEWAGTQLHVQPDAQPAFSIILFHVALAAPLSKGSRVMEGQELGTHVGSQTFSDVAVSVNTPHGGRLVSYFETLTDAALAPFQARGIATPAAVILTRAQRDAAPLACSGQTFTNAAADPYPAAVDF